MTEGSDKPLPFNSETRFLDDTRNPFGYTQKSDAKLVSGVDWIAWWNEGRPNVHNWLNTQGPRDYICAWWHEDGNIVADYTEPRTLACVQYECNNLNLSGYWCFPILAYNWLLAPFGACYKAVGKTFNSVDESKEKTEEVSQTRESVNE